MLEILCKFLIKSLGIVKFNAILMGAYKDTSHKIQAKDLEEIQLFMVKEKTLEEINFSKTKLKIFKFRKIVS